MTSTGTPAPTRCNYCHGEHADGSHWGWVIEGPPEFCRARYNDSESGKSVRSAFTASSYEELQARIDTTTAALGENPSALDVKMYCNVGPEYVNYG